MNKSKIIKIPKIPKIPSSKIEWLKKAAIFIYKNRKKIFEVLKKMKPFSDKSTTTEVVAFAEVMAQFREQYKPFVDEIVNQIQSSISEYSLYLESILKENQDIIQSESINLALFNKKMQRLNMGIAEKVKTEIYRIISLDNDECRQALKMPSAEQRESTMKQILDDAIVKAYDLTESELKYTMDEIYQEFAYILNNAVQKKENDIRRQNEEIQSLFANFDDENIIAIQIIKAKMLSEISDVVSLELEG